MAQVLLRRRPQSSKLDRMQQQHDGGSRADKSSQVDSVNTTATFTMSTETTRSADGSRQSVSRASPDSVSADARSDRNTTNDDADFVDFVPPSSEQLNYSHDRILANQMKAMTLQERERVYEEIHGVSAAQEETPELIDTSLRQLQTAIDDIRHKPAYLQAVQQNPNFVRDRDLRLRFLRAEAFRPKNAARRFVRHFDTKLELWGPDKLGRHIVIDDFDQDTRDVFFNCGSLQLLPYRDTSGRAIVLSWEKYQRQFFRTDDPKSFMARTPLLLYRTMSFPPVLSCPGSKQYSVLTYLRTLVSGIRHRRVLPSVLPSHRMSCRNRFAPHPVPDLHPAQPAPTLSHALHHPTPNNVQNRLFWYYMMSFTEDLETQRNGIVYIGYGLDFVPRLDDDELNVWWGCCAVANVVPVRITGFHYCYNDARLKPIISLLSLGVVSTVRCRIRTHLGTHQECLYSLMTFGIPYDAIPVNSEGEWRRTSYLKWAQRRQKKEQNMEKYQHVVELPSRNDVLLGRGKPTQTHAGNKRLHDIIAAHYDQYDASSRREKTKLAQQIIDIVKASPGRFLKRDGNDIWVEADDGTAREKVCHGFRRKREVDNMAVKQAAKEAETERREQRGMLDKQRQQGMAESTVLFPTNDPSWNYMQQQQQQQFLMKQFFQGPSVDNSSGHGASKRLRMSSMDLCNVGVCQKGGDKIFGNRNMGAFPQQSQQEQNCDLHCMPW